MALRIEREDLWRRLITRYLARTKAELTPEQERWLDTLYPILTQIVFPVTDFDKLAQNQKAVTINLDVSAGGIKTGLTVPPGKKWTVYALQVDSSVGVAEYNQIRLKDVSEDISITILHLDTPEQKIQMPGEYGMNLLELEEGDFFDVQVTTTDTTGIMRAWISEEDLY